MQAAYLKIFPSFYALVNRSLQSEFHTSACILKGSKGGRRPKNRPSKRANAPGLSRSPTRKRLVSSLKPEGKTDKGTYEVAPRNQGVSSDKSIRDRKPPGHGSTRQESGPGRDGASLKHEETPFVGKRAIAPQQEGPKFDREDAPHQGRIPAEEYHQGRNSLPRGRWAKRRRPNPEYHARGLLERGEYQASRSQRRRILQAPIGTSEFSTPEFEPLKTLPRWFSSPPLLEGLLKSVHEVLGPNARPSPIQSLSLRHLFTTPPHLRHAESAAASPRVSWNQHLLAAETGSGKSIAYLLPMLQHLKLTEQNPTPLHPAPSSHHQLPLNPRGLILAPTHELARQLSNFAKALLHHMRLRVLCVSRANNASSSRGRSTARQLKRELDETNFGLTSVGSVGLHGNRPVDVLVGTTRKVLEMVRGVGWDRATRIEEHWDEDRKERARQWVAGPPEMGLAAVEWVVVDEADVLFDRDFEASTRLLLADIARARGYSHASFAALDSSPETQPAPPSTPLAYPFHLTFTSATIPASLANYLSVAHPKLTRLASPHLHRLPSTLTTEHAALTSGNKNADIERRIRRVWTEDAQSAPKIRSKVLVFCNKSSKVEDLGLYLKEKGIPNVALTSESAARARGSNRHLEGFLKTSEDRPHDELSPSTHAPTRTDSMASSSATTASTALPDDPRVLITTSLLSRGLDFSSQIRYVFFADAPRNMIDFLHRAGRAGRAGNPGHVVIFGKSKGRGAGEAREVRQRIRAVAS